MTPPTNSITTVSSLTPTPSSPLFPSLFILPPTMSDTKHTEPALTTAKRAKPASPPEFDGGKKHYKAFMKSLLLHFANEPTAFNDQKKVVFALSYMTKGFAVEWAEEKQNKFIEAENF